MKRQWLALGLLFCCLGAVADGVVADDVVTTAPTDFPELFYRQALKQAGLSIFRVDTQTSQAIISVYSGGSLAKLGHDHVIDSRNLQGYLMLNEAQQQYQADLFIPLALLNVDDPTLRKAAHFTTQPTVSDIEGTREHMLVSVLEAKQFPFAQIHVSNCLVENNHYTAQVTLTLHGVSKSFDVPVVIEKITNGEKVSGKFSLRQTDYGMKPYSAVGGLLKVKDQVDLAFTLVAYPFSGK